MRIPGVRAIEQVEALVRRVVAGTRQAAATPRARQWMSRIPGGEAIRGLVAPPGSGASPEAFEDSPERGLRTDEQSAADMIAEGSPDAPPPRPARSPRVVPLRSAPAPRPARGPASRQDSAPARARSVPKTRGAAGESPARSGAYPAGTRVKILSGSYQGWSGELKWSRASGSSYIYNAKVQAPDGRYARTQLRQNALGVHWAIEPSEEPH